MAEASGNEISTKREVTTPAGVVIDLAPFCGDGDPREWLNVPFLFDGMTCATNGTIIVFVESASSAPELDQKNVENMARILRIARTPCDLLIDAQTVKTSTCACQFCGGEGKFTTEECEACDGQGYVYHKEESALCPICHGACEVKVTGEGETCPYCDGTGQTMINQPSSIGGCDWSVRSDFVKKLQSLPNCRIAGLIGAESWKSGIQFVFDGGCGVVMPLRRPALVSKEKPQLCPERAQ